MFEANSAQASLEAFRSNSRRPKNQQPRQFPS